MADIHIENDNREEVLADLEQAVKKALTAVGMQASSDVSRYIANYSPKPIVDTGLLKNSITYAISGKAPAIKSYSADPDKGDGKGSYSGTAPNDKIPAVYIGTNVEYAKYVQFGTSRMKPRDFMFAPIRANFDRYKEIMQNNLK